jgi:hypothetical protein
VGEEVEPSGRPKEQADTRPWWGDGDFYVPGFWGDGSIARIPGAVDFHRRLFLTRAAMIEPALLETLRKLAIDDLFGLALWAARWNLCDRWCLLLARAEVRSHSHQPSARGWHFEGSGIACGHFPFSIKPLVIGPFYFDPTQRRWAPFKRSVHEQVETELEKYGRQIESDALSAGLKRTPRKPAIGHFDWLARYQVRGESFASIAKHADFQLAGGRQTIRKAAVKLAAYLGLSLRPSTSGEVRRS